MPESIARTIATCSALVAVFCAALALLPWAVAQGAQESALLDGAGHDVHGNLSNGAGNPRVADDGEQQVSETLGSDSTAAFRSLANSSQRTTSNFRIDMTAAIDHSQKNSKAATSPYGQHANSAGSAMRPSPGNITVKDATLQTGSASAGMTFANDGCYSGISEHNGDTYPNTWSNMLCPGGNETGNADSRALYAQGHQNGSATDNASVHMAASGGPPHRHSLPIDAGCPARVSAGKSLFS
ncbi:hypothetical protein [Pseudomonas sp. SCB32]|uniref:hypothetical protein n=1 Tax=Pseudomonas sp. SCB32 TaxID=2653853 RepID=UPI0012656D67|nr:hypothetical protein [Pseudomonas sp. SCB32]